MKILSIIIICLLILIPVTAWSAGSKDAASTTERAEYVAERGLIVQPEEIYIDSIIAGLDYNYPKPEKDFGITLYSGHRQVSSMGQEEVIQI